LKPTKKTDQVKAWDRKKMCRISAFGTREKASEFLLFCEGKNTEPLYFKSFPLSTATVKAIGTGRSKTSLIEFGIDYLKRNSIDKETEVWFVFDMDIHYEQLVDQKGDFNNAIVLATSKNCFVAYSNDSIELWFALYCQIIVAQMTRKEFDGILSEHWGVDYEKAAKKKAFSETIYNLLQNDPNADQMEATRRAEKIWNECQHLNPADQNPCSTVFQLVKKLMKYQNL